MLLAVLDEELEAAVAEDVVVDAVRAASEWLPRSRGAISELKLAAAVTPVTRIRRSRGRRVVLAVRTAATDSRVAGGAFRVRALCQINAPKTTIATTINNTSQGLDRFGLREGGGTTSGSAKGARGSTAGAGAPLMYECIPLQCTDAKSWRRVWNSPMKIRF